MRFSLTALLTVAAATVVAAANVLVDAPGNAISQPTAGDVVDAGKPYTIVWDPSEGETVTLVLRKGDSGNLDTLDTIADDIENKGTYSWTPSPKLPSGDDYAIEIIWGTGEDMERNYSPMFTVKSDVKETTTTTTTTDASSTTATSTATETETVTGTTTMVTSTIMANTTSSSTSTRSSGPRPTKSGEPVIPSDDKGAAGKVGISMLAVAAAAVAYFA